MASYTQEQVEKLREAIALGVTEIESSSGERLRFRSLSEMRTLLGIMEADVAATATTGSRYFQPKFDRGL